MSTGFVVWLREHGEFCWHIITLGLLVVALWLATVNTTKVADQNKRLKVVIGVEQAVEKNGSRGACERDNDIRRAVQVLAIEAGGKPDHVLGLVPILDCTKAANGD